MTLRAAWLPFVDDKRVASVRLRTHNPVDILRQDGVSARVLGRGGPTPDEVLILQKAYSQDHLAMAQQHRASGGAVVLDLCDNHFVKNDADPVLEARAARLMAILPHVDVVSVCTSELGEVVPHPETIVVNDALDVIRPRPQSRFRRRYRDPSRVDRVLWFGTAGAHDLPFGIRDLARVLPALGRAGVEHPFDLVVMSNSRAAFSRLPVPPDLRARYVPWSAKAFARVAAVSDVAVLPVEINAVTRGKTSNRVATAFQHGMNVVTDPLPSYLDYRECVRFGGYEEHVVEYLQDKSLRADHVRTGREITERLYAPSVISRQWRDVIERAALLRDASSS
ncbi:hypothetical protein [Nocardioides astragali]|uniref:Glycosyltransferase family 1 protein n=1 Tax=Nocardioides astragali TaxID=1776736 RepID=A0ABW2N0N7_9ACTN|nr:hypothetical protein [Nocardioides astragali]